MREPEGCGHKPARIKKGEITMTIYDYEELKIKALAADATQEDINALGEWFDQYGFDYWNGEYFRLEDGHRIYPILKEELDEDGELEQADVIGYEIR